MATEIERKFLVTTLNIPQLPDGEKIDQGYLVTEPLALRVRTKGGKGFLAIKYADGPDAVEGAAIRRHEFEYEIPVPDAEELLERCPTRLIKTRYLLPSGIELDIFHGRHEGLVVAEYESPDGAIPPAPEGIEWKEVTSDPRYSNAWLAENGMPQG